MRGFYLLFCNLIQFSLRSNEIRNTSSVAFCTIKRVMTMSIAKISRKLSSLSDTYCMSYYSICYNSCVSLFLCFFFCSSFMFSFLSPICSFINTQSQIVKHFCCLHDTKLMQIEKEQLTNANMMITTVQLCLRS